MDATKRPLLIPPEFSTYAEKHGIFQIYEKILQKLIINQPDDPIQYMIELIQEPDDDVPHIIIHGPPGTGKSAMARLVADNLNCVHITKESLLGLSKDGSEQKVSSDKLVSLVKKRIEQRDCLTKLLDHRNKSKKGWIFEGFPDTREQTLTFQAAGIIPSHFVLLDAPDTVLIERVMGKRVDPITGDVYHTTFDPPSNPDILRRLEPDPDSSEETMIKRLMQYHRTIDGILKCYDKVYKRINADQPKTDVLSQVLAYLSTKQRSNAPHTPRVILLGPTGSGKSVQASLLASKYQLVNVCYEDLIDEALNDESDLGEAMKPFIEKGVMIPDDFVLQLLTNRLGQLDAVKRGWVVHGFPKTRVQAENLSRLGYEPNRIIFLDVPMDTIMERLTLRSVDPITGERYHLLYAPPRTTEIRDRLKVHPDDKESAVLQRISEYQAHSEDVADFYEDALRINADQDLQTVFENIESIIVNPLPQPLEVASS